MRLAIVIVLLAGCSQAPGPTSETAPLYEDPLGPRPDDLHLHETGSVAPGETGSWEWTIDPRAIEFEATIHVLGPGANGQHGTLLMATQAEIVQNGTRITGRDHFLQASFGTNPVLVFDHGARAHDVGLEAFSGHWEMRLDPGSTVLDFEVRVDVLYD